MGRVQRGSEQQHGAALVCRGQRNLDSQQQCCDSERDLDRESAEQQMRSESIRQVSLAVVDNHVVMVGNWHL
jgi:hypothetical protein